MTDTNGYKAHKRRIEAALSKIPADVVFKNGKIVNVFTGEIEQGDVAVTDGIIVGIGQYSGEREIDLEGGYLCPGLVDSHLHLESSMVRPAEVVSAAALCGTTTFIADPHEAANVAGADGVDYMLKSTEGLMADVYFMLPSCVPALPFEQNGAVFTAEEMQKFIGNSRILGLGEVMDLPAVLGADEQMYKKLALFSNIDGHNGVLKGKELCAFRLSGICTDHECTDIDAAENDLRNGIYVQLREGSAAHNVADIVKGLISRRLPLNRVCFCTDDKHLAAIKKDGHINYNMKIAVENGMPPIDAVRAATINAAVCYGLKGIGAVAPGYYANFAVFSDLLGFKTIKSFYKGEEIRPVKEFFDTPAPLRQTVHLRGIPDFVPVSGPAISFLDGQILTARSSGGDNIAAVIERHKMTGDCACCRGDNFGIKNGAVASSISHDSHNIVVIGDNTSDMRVALEALMAEGGGISVVEGGRVYKTLPLPIMGLMSEWEGDRVDAELHDMLQKAYSMGVNKNLDPFVTLSFLALPVIPELRLCSRGVYDVVNGKFI